MVERFLTCPEPWQVFVRFPPEIAGLSDRSLASLHRHDFSVSCLSGVCSRVWHSFHPEVMWDISRFSSLVSQSVNPCLPPPRRRGGWCVCTVCVDSTTLEYFVKMQWRIAYRFSKCRFSTISRPCGLWRRCATLFHPGIGAFPVDTQMESQARASGEQFFIGDWPYHSILSTTSWCTLWTSGQI